MLFQSGMGSEAALHDLEVENSHSSENRLPSLMMEKAMLKILRDLRKRLHIKRLPSLQIMTMACRDDMVVRMRKVLAIPQSLNRKVGTRTSVLKLVLSVQIMTCSNSFQIKTFTE